MHAGSAGPVGRLAWVALIHGGDLIHTPRTIAVSLREIMADLLVAAGAPTTTLADVEQQQLEPNDDALRPVLQNIVATCNLGCDLELKTIAMHARNAEYNPKRFSAVIMRIRDPKTTALIFRSGKMVVTGAKSEE